MEKQPRSGPIQECLLSGGNCVFNTYMVNADSEVDFRGIFIFVHGWSEHILMYLDLAYFVASLGYDFFAFDLRESGKTRGPYTDVDCPIRDLDFVIEKSTTKYKSFNLIGHSMGGAIILDYLCKGKYRNMIDSVILSGPCVKLHDSIQPNPLKRMFVNIILYWFPGIRYWESKSISAYALVTTNEKKQLEMFNDKLCCPNGPLKIISDMYYRGKRLVETIPDISNKARILIFQSENDSIVDPSAVKSFFNDLSSTTKKIVCIENSGHALFLEKESTVELINKEIESFLKTQ